MSKRSHTPFNRTSLLAILALTALLAFLAAGCGKDETGGEGSPPPDYEKALAGAPPKLAALYDQADELLPGGQEAFDARIEDLKGHPVVVNIWGSWCGPCILEFPHFQEASAKLGKKVAFLGVNSQDNQDAAETLLRDYPVPYPSYEDPDRDITFDLDATHGLPATAFFDAEGNLAFTKSGAYSSTEEIEEDVKLHALGESG